MLQLRMPWWRGRTLLWFGWHHLCLQVLAGLCEYLFLAKLLHFHTFTLSHFYTFTLSYFHTLTLSYIHIFTYGNKCLLDFVSFYSLVMSPFISCWNAKVLPFTFTQTKGHSLSKHIKGRSRWHVCYVVSKSVFDYSLVIKRAWNSFVNSRDLKICQFKRLENVPIQETWKCANSRDLKKTLFGIYESLNALQFIYNLHIWWRVWYILSHFHTLTLSYFHTSIHSHFHTFTLSYFHTFILSHFHTFTLSYFLIFTLSHRQSATLISQSCMMGCVKTSVEAHTVSKHVSRERCERICLKIFYWNVFSNYFSFLDLRGYRI